MKDRCSGMAILLGFVFRCELENGHGGACIIVDDTMRVMDVAPIAQKVLEMRNAAIPRQQVQSGVRNEAER